MRNTFILLTLLAVGGCKTNTEGKGEGAAKASDKAATGDLSGATDDQLAQTIGEALVPAGLAVKDHGGDCAALAAALEAIVAEKGTAATVKEVRRRGIVFDAATHPEITAFSGKLVIAEGDCTSEPRVGDAVDNLVP